MSLNTKPTILIVDDSDITRASLSKIFDEYNCTVILCTDGMAGIQKALIAKPELIILDILMPNLDGIKMLQIIKLIEELKDISVIVLSGNINKSNLLAAMEAGADKVINKPFSVNDLIAATDELLGYQLEKKTLTQMMTTLKICLWKNFLRRRKVLLNMLLRGINNSYKQSFIN